MNAIAPWFAGFLAGAIAGALGGGFFVWAAARARWIEREAEIEREHDRDAQLTRWREEAIRRGMMHELTIRESSARIVQPQRPTLIARAKG